MKTDEMLARLDDSADRIVRLGRVLSKSPIANVLAKQLVKSGTSIGANYREAQRASSKRHFITTVEIATREADETQYWLRRVQRSGLIKPHRLDPLVDESDQILAILIAIGRSAKKRP